MCHGDLWRDARGHLEDSAEGKWVCELGGAHRTWARMHHKVFGNFGSEADARSLYYSRFRFNETSDVGADTHGRPVK